MVRNRNYLFFHCSGSMEFNLNIQPHVQLESVFSLHEPTLARLQRFYLKMVLENNLTLEVLFALLFTFVHKHFPGGQYEPATVPNRPVPSLAPPNVQPSCLQPQIHVVRIYQLCITLTIVACNWGTENLVKIITEIRTSK